MQPYFSCPFVFYNRKGAIPPQVIMPPPVQCPPCPTCPVCPVCPECPEPTPYVPPQTQVQPMMMPQQMIQPPPMMPQQIQQPCPYQTAIPMYPPSISNAPMENMECMEDMEDSAYISEPDDYSVIPEPGRETPVLTNPAPIPGTILVKELSGYPAYGNPSGNADILYTGTRGEWNFRLPTWLPSPQSLRGQILIRAVLDDHVNVPIQNYSLRVRINNATVHNGPVPLQHGTPPGGPFINWGLLIFDIPNLRNNNRVQIFNNSTAGSGDWIALDWMELRLFYR